MSEKPEISKCRFCGAEIKWVKRDSMGGTCIPVNAKPVKMMLWHAIDQRWHKREGHVMHFETCTKKVA